MAEDCGVGVGETGAEICRGEGGEPGAERSEVRGPVRTGAGRPWTGTIM